MVLVFMQASKCWQMCWCRTALLVRLQVVMAAAASGRAAKKQYQHRRIASTSIEPRQKDLCRENRMEIIQHQPVNSNNTQPTPKNTHPHPPNQNRPPTHHAPPTPPPKRNSNPRPGDKTITPHEDVLEPPCHRGFLPYAVAVAACQISI